MKRMIETERLTLRPLAPDDYKDVFEWVSDPEVNKYMPYPLYTDLEAVKKWIASITPEQNEFAFVLKNIGKVIGSGSVRYDDELDGFTFGYNLNRQYWGNGYATEAAKAMIEWARRELGVKKFVAVFADDNVASGNVIRKCGLTFSHHTTYSKFDGSATFSASYYIGHFEKLQNRSTKEADGA